MSKSKKRFYTRIAIVAVVLSLGTVALIQSIRSGSTATDNQSESQPRTEADQPPAGELGKQQAADNTAVVRANNDDDPSAPPTLPPAATAAALAASPPPSQYGGSFASQAGYDSPAQGPGAFQQVAHEEPIGSGLRPTEATNSFQPTPAGHDEPADPSAPPSAYAPASAEPGQFSPPPSAYDPRALLSPADQPTPNEPTPAQESNPGDYTPPSAQPNTALPNTALPADANPYAAPQNAYAAPQEADAPGYPDESYPSSGNPANTQSAPGTQPEFGGFQQPAAYPAESPSESTYAAIAAGAGAPASLPPSTLSQAPLQPAASGATGNGSPGPQDLEGVQTPALSIIKSAPPEIQVNKPATFTIRVQNTGRVPAQDVTVRDQIPAGVRYLDSTPQSARDAQGALVWKLGTIEPGEESSITLRVLPLAEGEIGSTADVTFAAQATMRTICTKPMLTVKQSAPRQVLIGQEAAFSIVISNPGTGSATGIILEEDVPEQFNHPAGRELEHTIGELKPGESRELELRLKADKAGVAKNLILVRGEGNLIAQHEVEVEVIAPSLVVGMNGPKLRYLERQATYTVQVSNPGTAPAKNVELVAHLPRGLKFVSTNNAGQYDTQRHAVYWSLEQLPAKESGAVQLTTMPVEIGEQKIRVEGAADLNLTHSSEEIVTVEGLAELFFQVRDEADPIELGSDTVYAVEINNQGSVPATNVVVVALLPPELQPLGGEGPTRVLVEGQQVTFAPLQRLSPKGDAVYRIQVKGRVEGDHRIRVQVMSDQTRTPVTKEESTRVYSDR
ncbi:DUF11 domain-containing protein [Lignipirellula cremea]|uniref:60 kDa outer membrane protein n=1 Tax=Lignipirellula cremea TaxID=2528010 RepID=A0A518DWJ1_9BACT|nr:DUF11 domain-containing protein [Lignipirellula cremea]QDU96201.1 Large cysteine-rich periplasmic protein OmcB [Lignipirellula cremea]